MNTISVINSDISESNLAASLSGQYQQLCLATGELVRRTIAFGSMLAQVEVELERRGLLGNRKSGQGLQSWLSEHCPDVNYKTAMRWKSLALQAANSLHCSSDTALRLLTGEVIDVSANVSERRDKIFEQCSLRKLTQQLFDFASEDRGSSGRPAGTSSSLPSQHFSQVDSARRLWARPLSLFRSNRQAFYSAAKLLPLDDARDALAELKQLSSALKSRIDERN